MREGTILTKVDLRFMVNETRPFQKYHPCCAAGSELWPASWSPLITLP